jgi:hypothetical protein
VIHVCTCHVHGRVQIWRTRRGVRSDRAELHVLNGNRVRKFACYIWEGYEYSTAYQVYLVPLVAPPPPPAGALPPPAGVLTKLKVLDLERTQVTDAGCAALAAALESGALPALEAVYMIGIPASAAAEAAVKEALKRTASRAAMPS